MAEEEPTEAKPETPRPVKRVKKVLKEPPTEKEPAAETPTAPPKPVPKAAPKAPAKTVARAPVAPKAKGPPTKKPVARPAPEVKAPAEKAEKAEAAPAAVEKKEPEKKEPAKEKKKAAAKKPAKKPEKKPAKKGEKKGKEAEEEAEEEEEEHEARKKPDLTDAIRAALKIRLDIARRRPTFYRQEWYRHPRLGEKWRKPQGGQSKLRRHLGYRINVVSIGFRGPRPSRGLHPSGFQEVLVHTVNELEGLDPKRQAVRIAGGVGDRKRQKIQEEADDKGLRVLNPRVE